MGKDKSSSKKPSLNKNDSGGKKDDVKVDNNKKGKISKYGRIQQQQQQQQQNKSTPQQQRKLVKVFEKVSTSSASSASKDKRNNNNKDKNTPTSQEEDNKAKRKNGRRRRRKPQDSSADEGGFVSLNFNPDDPIITNVQQQNEETDHNNAKRHYSDINRFRDDSIDDDNNDRRKRQRRGKRKRKSMDDEDVIEGASSSKAALKLDDVDNDDIVDKLLMTNSKSSGRKTKNRMEREMKRKESIALKKIKKLGKRNAQEESIRAIVEQQERCDASSFFKDLIHQNMKKKSIMNTIYNDDSSCSSADDRGGDQDYVPYNMPWMVDKQNEMSVANENDDVVLHALDYELNAFGTYVRLSQHECHVRQQIIQELNTVAQNLFEDDVDANLLSSSTRHVRFHSITSSVSSTGNIDSNDDEEQNLENGMSINTCNGIDNRHPIHFQVFGSFATQEVCIFSSDIDLALHGVLPSLSTPSSAMTPYMSHQKKESRKGAQHQKASPNELSIEYVKTKKNDKKLEQYDIIIKNDNQVIEEAKKLKIIEGLTYDEAILISSTSEDEVDDESNGKGKGIQGISDLTKATSDSIIHTISSNDLFCIDRMGDKLTEEMNRDVVLLRTGHEDNNNNSAANNNRQMISTTQLKNELKHQITNTSFDNSSSLECDLKLGKEQDHNNEVTDRQMDSESKSSYDYSITTKQQQLQSTSTSGNSSSTDFLKKEPEKLNNEQIDQVAKEPQQQTIEIVTTAENPSTVPATTEPDKVNESEGSIVDILKPETSFSRIKSCGADGVEYPVTDLRSDELQHGERKKIVTSEDAENSVTKEVNNDQGPESKDEDINEEDDDVSDDDTADKMESFTTESHATKTKRLEEDTIIPDEDAIIPDQEVKMGFSFKDQGWETKDACSNSNAKLLQRKHSTVTLTASTDDEDSSACFDDDIDSDSIDKNNDSNTEVCFSTSGVISNVKTPAMMIKEMFRNDPCTISAQKLKDMSVDKLGRLWRTLRQAKRITKSIQFIRKARVPIIKIMTHYGFETDIAVAGNNGTDTSLYAANQVQSYQSFSAVVLFLKVLLAQNDLDAPFTGGLGSYKLYVLVAFHIQNHLSRGGTDRPGEVLLSFLYRYGGGHHKNMKQKRSSYQDDDQSLVTFLSQDTPLQAIYDGPNISNAGAASGTADLSNVYRLDSVVNLFRRCWELLINRMRILHRNNDFQQNDAKRCMDRLPSFLTGMVDADRLQYEREESWNLMDCDTNTVLNGGSRNARNNIRGGQQQQQQRNYPIQRTKTIPKRKSHEPFAFKRNMNMNHNNARNNNNNNSNSNKKMNNKNQQGDRSAKELLKSYNASVEDVRRYSNNNYKTPNKVYRRW